MKRKISAPQIDFQKDGFFEPYLSRRFFESCRGVFIVPFFHGKNFIGSLLEFSEIDNQNPFVLESFPADYHDQIASFLMKSREKISQIPSENLCEMEQIPQFSEILVTQAKKEEKRVIFFIFDFSSILEHLKNIFRFVDTYYLKLDLQKTAALLSSQGGFCASLENNRMILAIKAKNGHSQYVITHQIRQLFLKQSYISSDKLNLPFLTRIWPDDDLHISSLLSDFVSDFNG